MANTMKENVVGAVLGVMLSVAVSSAVAATFTFSDANCDAFTYSNNTLSCTAAGSPAPAASVPTCSISPSAASAPAGTGQQFTASCTDGPTSYAWTVDGTPVAGTTNYYTTATNLPVAVHTVAVIATNGIGPSAVKSASLTVSQAPAQPNPTACAQSNTITPLDFGTASGKNFNTIVNTMQARSLQLTTGSSGSYGYFITEMNTQGLNVNKFMNVSTSPCDFSYSNYDAGNGCADSGQFTKVSYQVQDASSPAIAQVCSLQPNTTYYVNIRNEKVYTDRSGSGRGVDTCPSGSSCAFVFGMQKY